MVKVPRLPEPVHPPYYDVLASSAISAFMLTVLDDTTAGAARTTLGLGTAATQNIGTSGATVPLLNTACTWDGTQTIGPFDAGGATEGKRFTSTLRYALDSSVSTTAAASHYRIFNPNGAVGSIQSNASATAYNTSSDERLKRNFRDFDAGSIIDAISIYEYEWRVDGQVGYGPKAQELFATFPQAVSVGSIGDEPGDETFDPWGYDASKLVPILIREVQDLRARVAALEAR